MEHKIPGLLREILEQEESNRLQQADGEIVTVFDEPLTAYAEAADPRFERLRHPGIVGEHACLPTEFMPEAKTVMAMFFPYSEAVRASNRAGTDPSLLWLQASERGKTVTAAVIDKLIAALEKEGVKAIDPTRGPGFKAVIGGGLGKGPVVGIGAEEAPAWEGKSYTCNWSERHVAFVCGLGTFGISGGFITAKGAAGVLLTLILDREVEPSQGGCGDPYGNCARCGACARRCPAKAISMEKGYSPAPCMAREDATLEQFAPLRGCGKCRVGVPCEFQNPTAK